MSVVAEVDAILKSLAQAKPPGVSGSKIKQLTEISQKNVKVIKIELPKLFFFFFKEIK